MHSGSCALKENVMQGEGVGTKRRSYDDGQNSVKKSFSAPMLPRSEKEHHKEQSVVILSTL